MINKKVTNSDKREPKRIDIFEEFVLWSAMPPTERYKLGIETQEQFVEFYKIGINTPTAWKQRRGYEERVTALRKEWAFGKTSAVIEGIYRSALKGNPMSQKLWLQYFHGFSEKLQIAQASQVVITTNDIRFLIESLPEPMKSKHYMFLRELLDDSVAAKDAGTVDASFWVERPVESENVEEKGCKNNQPYNVCISCSRIIKEFHRSHLPSSAQWCHSFA